MKKIGILASYNGSGFETIQKAIDQGILDAKVCVIITNNSNAGVLEKASKYGIESFVINKNLFPDENLDLKIAQTLKKFDCDYIFLSGYMKKIEENLLKTFPHKIINTHPAILPSIYGGAGMYGHFIDRKSTRLNSSHPIISYAVFCLKKTNPRAQSRTALAPRHKSRPDDP